MEGTESHPTDVMRTGVDIVDLFPEQTETNQYVAKCIKLVGDRMRYCPACTPDGNCDKATDVLEKAFETVSKYLIINKDGEASTLAEARSFMEQCRKSLVRCYMCAAEKRVDAKLKTLDSKVGR